MWLNKYPALAAVLAASATLASADVIQLKDQASVSGKILTEKTDSVVVDVGYTVLIIPRASIANIIKSSATKAYG